MKIPAEIELAMSMVKSEQVGIRPPLAKLSLAIFARMKFLKRTFVKIFGLKNYFLFVSGLFFFLYRLGMLRGNRKFDCHYYIRNLIHEGDHAIDIGANFGYYSILFSDLVKSTGKVYAVEPVNLYREILARNKANRNNIEIYPFALGEEDRKQIEMGIPGTDISRHGLTRIITNSGDTSAKTFSATMRNPQILFAGLTKLNYIKCDVEGYEMHVIPLLLPLILKFKPKLQIETDGENKKQLVSLLESNGYKTNYVDGKVLRSLKSVEELHSGDLFFIPA